MATYSKAFIIYNPCAGKLRGRADQFIARAMHILAESGQEAEAVPTTGPNTAGALARSCIDRGAGLILVAGGDGTINEVINGAVHSDTAIGILPCGTANVLATELGIGKKLEVSAKLVAQCTPVRISLGLLQCAGQEPRHFAMMAGAGLDAHIVYHINPDLKKALGKVAYWISGFVHGMRRLPELTVEAAGVEYLSSFILASRVRNYGGDLEIARDISLLDHDFEVVLFGGANPLRYVKYLSAVLLRKTEGMKGLTFLRTETLKLSDPRGRRIHIQVDGEYVGELPATIGIVPRSLTLLIPPAFSARNGG